MQPHLKDHFNRHAQTRRKRREARRRRDRDFFILWALLLLLMARQRAGKPDGFRPPRFP